MAERPDDLSALEAALGVTFRDRDLLIEALTHRSYFHEHLEATGRSYERLEFLGDAVFHLVVAAELFKRYPDAGEGELTALRASLVSTQSFALVAEELRLADYLRVSRSEGTVEGRGRQSILADCLEALVAAVYCDRGMAAARALVNRLIRPRIADARRRQPLANVKGRLQELVQGHQGLTPSYRVVERSGPVHEQRFVVEVMAGDRVLGRGEGIGKRAAEQEAARAALDGYGATAGEAETLSAASALADRAAG